MEMMLADIGAYGFGEILCIILSLSCAHELRAQGHKGALAFDPNFGQVELYIVCGLEGMLANSDVVEHRKCVLSR